MAVYGDENSYSGMIYPWFGTFRRLNDLAHPDAPGHAGFGGGAPDERSVEVRKHILMLNVVLALIGSGVPSFADENTKRSVRSVAYENRAG